MAAATSGMMQELDAADDIDNCLPTAQFHYDLEELDLEPPAGDLWTDPPHVEPPPHQFDEPPDAPDFLGDGSFWFYIQADLLQIATTLVAFFGEPSSQIATVKCHKIHAAFSPTCAVKVQVYSATAGLYLLEIADMGSDEALFYDILWQATEFLMSCGCYLWETV